MNCDKTPKPFVDCCTVMDCISIQSPDNSITVEKNECGVDITLSGNNLEKAIHFNNGTCITLTTEIIDGKLTITPTIDWDCVVNQIGADICNLCPPPVPTPICPAAVHLVITNI